MILSLSYRNCKNPLDAHLKKMAECLWTQMGVVGIFVCGWKDGTQITVNRYSLPLPRVLSLILAKVMIIIT